MTKVMAKSSNGVYQKGDNKPQEAVFIEARKSHQYNFTSVKDIAWTRILDSKMSGSEIRLLIGLLELYRPPIDKQCIPIPSIPRLASRLGVTIQFVYRNLNNLEERGVIVREESEIGGGKIIIFANWLVY